MGFISSNQKSAIRHLCLLSPELQKVPNQPLLHVDIGHIHPSSVHCVWAELGEDHTPLLLIPVIHHSQL